MTEVQYKIHLCLSRIPGPLGPDKSDSSDSFTRNNGQEMDDSIGPIRFFDSSPGYCLAAVSGLIPGVEMLSAGIDIGAQNIKVVLLNQDKMLAYSIVPSGWDTNAAIETAFSDIQEKSGVERAEVRYVGATGMGRENTSFATVYSVDSTCSALGAVWLRPSVRTIIDIGAEQSRVLRCDQGGRVLDRVRNDQCAAGAGAFLEEIALRLEMEMSELGELSLSSKEKTVINSTCVIFAESEVVSLINEGVRKEDIARAIVDAAADKAVSLMRSLKVEDDILFIGGVAKNVGVVDSLKRQMERDILVPPEPRIVSAVGAALIAGKNKSENKLDI